MLLIAYKYYSNNMEIDMLNSPSQTSPASSLLEEGQSALDGSEPATGDEIRELQQIGNPERLSSHYLIEDLCGLNHRSWGEYKDGKAISGQALAQLLGRFQIEPNQQRMGSNGPVRGYNRQDFLTTCDERFAQLVEDY